MSVVGQLFRIDLPSKIYNFTCRNSFSTTYLNPGSKRDRQKAYEQKSSRECWSLRPVTMSDYKSMTRPLPVFWGYLCWTILSFQNLVPFPPNHSDIWPHWRTAFLQFWSDGWCCPRFCPWIRRGWACIRLLSFQRRSEGLTYGGNHSTTNFDCTQ